MAKECFKALALVAPEALTDGQLGMLWGAHMRYQQLGHVVLDPNPLLAESYSVFAREVRRLPFAGKGNRGHGCWTFCLYIPRVWCQSRSTFLHSVVPELV
jgi:hypothetical protein